MKTLFKTVITILISISFLNSIAQQNGDFENWTETYQYESPSIWGSTNDKAGSIIQTVIKSTDAKDQVFSLKLESKTLFGDTVMALAVLGNVDNGPRGGFPYASNPDSLIFWIKYNVRPGDSATAFALGKKAGVVIGFELKKYHGIQATWKREAIKLNMAITDSLLIAFAAGDVDNDFSIPGTILMIDNIQVKDTAGVMFQVPNHSFENWDSIHYSDPMNWYSLNYLLNMDSVVSKSTLSHSGSFSAEMRVIEKNGDTIKGLMSNAPFLGLGSWFSKIPYLARPAKMDLYYTYLPNGSDGAGFSIELFNNGVTIGSGLSYKTTAVTSFTLLSIPITYTSSVTPDSMRIVFSPGGNPGSKLNVDLVTLLGGTVSIQKLNLEKSLKYFPNPVINELNIYYKSFKSSKKASISIIDINGRIITRSVVNPIVGSNIHKINTVGLPKGMYSFILQIDNKIISKRFVKR